MRRSLDQLLVYFITKGHVEDEAEVENESSYGSHGYHGWISFIHFVFRSAPHVQTIYGRGADDEGYN